MRCCHRFLLACTACSLLLEFAIRDSRATDLHAFEFNEGFGTILSFTSDSGTPGGASWVESNNLTDSETDGSGNFVIKKFSDNDADNYLQIDNIDENTVGSRYLVARMSSWDFYDSVVGEGEGIWLAFLDNDSGDSGSTVTAQVLVDRNTDTGDIELRGSAIGVGSRNIGNRFTLSNTQTAPFTMVLELDKTSNTYEVFYKDGTNPSQSLGIAPVGPARNGNSVRFAVNNNFGSTLDEFFSIDRIAITDTNPLTDLMTMDIDRDTGVMTLKNTAGTALTGLRSYTITSSAGALDAANWKSITDFYDQSPGDGSVDPDGAWMKTSTATDDLSEEVVGGNGGNLAINQEVVLSMGSGSWIKNPDEDVEIVLNFDDGMSRRANVNFVGNGGKRFEAGDLNFDGALSPADWTVFIAGSETDLTGLSEAQAYQAGDLNNDGENSIFDFAIFKNAYEEANGAGSFEAMLASIPEPHSIVLFALGAVSLVCRRCHKKTLSATHVTSRQSAALKVDTMHCTRTFALVLLSVISLALQKDGSAAVLEEFVFDEPNGTLLDATLNSGTPGNMWNEDTTDMSGSSVQNGKYHVQKDNDGFGTNYLDITNVTSGKSWLVAEISGWSLSSLVGPGEFDSGQLEEIRFAYLNNDGNDQGGSQIVGQAQFQRNSTGGFELVGRLTTSSVDTDVLPLSLVRSTPFTVAVEIDEDAENYSIYYKDDSAPFTLLGTAPHVATRDGNSVRFVANNNFSGTGEFFDIDRIYLTDTDPINVVSDRLKLQVNTLTGEIKLMNDTATTFDIDSYRITSSTTDLNLANWTSLSDRNPLIDPVDGPDLDSTLGNGVGETWDEAAGSSDSVLAESFLLGSSIFSTNREESLGNAFKVGGDTNSLGFQYRNADSGAIVTGDIEFISMGPSADFDHDGDVDGNDFLVWQRGGSPNPLSASDLAVWQSQFGAGTLAAAQAVPEPGGALLMALMLVGWASRERK